MIDTGGWFRNGCPTSQVAKPEIHGVIYRILVLPTLRNTRTPEETKSIGVKATDKEMLTRFADPRPVVREKALQAMVNRGPVAVPALS